MLTLFSIVAAGSAVKIKLNNLSGSLNCERTIDDGELGDRTINDVVMDCFIELGIPERTFYNVFQDTEALTTDQFLRLVTTIQDEISLTIVTREQPPTKAGHDILAEGGDIPTYTLSGNKVQGTQEFFCVYDEYGAVLAYIERDNYDEARLFSIVCSLLFPKFFETERLRELPPGVERKLGTFFMGKVTLEIGDRVVDHRVGWRSGILYDGNQSLIARAHLPPFMGFVSFNQRVLGTNRSVITDVQSFCAVEEFERFKNRYEVIYENVSRTFAYCQRN